MNGVEGERKVRRMREKIIVNFSKRRQRVKMR